MATMNFNPSSDDGILKADAVWATAHGATTGTLRGGNDIFVQASNGYNIDRGFLVFDTSALPNDATITGATLTVTGTFKSGAIESPDYNLFNTTCSDTVIAGDFDLVGTTPYATTIRYTAWNGAGTNTWTLNAAGIAAISLTGLTKICVREAQFDVSNTAPNNTKFIGFASVETANKPVLAVTYTVPSTANPGFLLNFV